MTLQSIKEQQKIWRDKNRDWVRQREQNYALTHREKLLVIQSRSTAKRRGLDHNIEETDIIIPEYCPLLGVKLTSLRNSGRVDTNISLDRIDSTKGYIKGNIWVISDLANKMKSNATKGELLTFARGIIKLYDTTDN